MLTYTAESRMTETFTSVSIIAGALLKVLALLLVAAAVPVVWSARRASRKLTDVIDRFRGDLHPLVQHVTAIADDVHHVTSTIRSDVALLDRTVAEGNRRVRDAIALTEQRLRHFNALLEVVQQEAEQLFVASAATVRGVRSGAAALRNQDGPEFAVEDVGGSADEGELTEELEAANGHEHSAGPTENRSAHPRVRARSEPQR